MSCYVYYIAVDGVVRYVGKGTGKRVVNHFKYADRINQRRAAGLPVKTNSFYNRLAKSMREGRRLQYYEVATRLSSDVAFEIEKSHIASFPAGQLWNSHSGGNGMSSDDVKKLWQLPEFRESQAKGVRQSNRVRIWTDEMRMKQSQKSKAIMSDPVRREFMRQKAIKEWEEIKAK